MGNRAVICHSRGATSTAIYVHWNGGPGSVLAFLEICRRRKYRDPQLDAPHGMARLCGLICEFFGAKSDTGVGISTLQEADTDNWDNGTYLLGEGWTIKKRFGKGSASADGAKTYADLNEEERKKHDAIVELFTNGV